MLRLKRFACEYGICMYEADIKEILNGSLPSDKEIILKQNTVQVQGIVSKMN